MSAGLAKTDDFLLGTAEVMIGAQADLHDLNPTDHSIGLVKNVSVSQETQYQELRQGVRNSIVFSKLNQSTTRVSMEVYEYTAKNLAYGLALDGASMTPTAVATTLNGATSGDETAIDFTSATSFAADDYIEIADGPNNVFIRRIVSISTNTVTITPAIPTGEVIADGARIRKVNVLGLGTKTDQPFFSCKIVGQLADSNDTVGILLPKVRIMRGFNLAFSSEDYGNMPFELGVYDLVSTDPHYAEFGTDTGRIYRP